MIRIYCEYDAGMPLSYRGVVVHRDDNEVARFADGGYDDDIRAAMRYVVEQHDSIPSLDSTLWYFQQDAGDPPRRRRARIL